MSSFYQHAATHQLIAANPTAGVRRPKVDGDHTATIGLDREQARALLHAADGDGWQQRLLTFAHQRGRSAELQQILGEVRGFGPDLDSLQDQYRRPGGAALTSYGLTEGRILRPDVHDRETVVELEVRENGGLRIFMSRLSDSLRSHPGRETEVQVMFEAAAVIYARRLLALVVGAAEEAGYFGNWLLAAGATGLRDCYSYRRSRSFISDGPRYGEDRYERAVLATYAELTATPGKVAAQLVAPLLRAFGTAQA